VCGVLSIATTPFALAILLATQVTIDTFAINPVEIKRMVLPVWITCTAIWFITSIAAALARRERHLWLAFVGAVVTASFTVLFIREA